MELTAFPLTLSGHTFYKKMRQNKNETKPKQNKTENLKKKRGKLSSAHEVCFSLTYQSLTAKCLFQIIQGTMIPQAQDLTQFYTKVALKGMLNG